MMQSDRQHKYIVFIPIEKLQRLGIPSDVAPLVRFLLSEEASWITGETVVIDGGVSVAGGLG